jgi:hypothetical protein
VVLQMVLQVVLRAALQVVLQVQAVLLAYAEEQSP